jgi:exoribonuclease-2
MLPERLSTDLTSLADHEERLAIVIEMILSPEGALVGSDIYRALVKNRAKLAYGSVAGWLDGAGPMPPPVQAVAGMETQLRVQDRIAQVMKMRRHQHGALHLETIEPRAVFQNDVLTDLRIDPKNRAKDLIEDFMIAANGVTARFLKAKGFPSLRRVLRSPKRWAKIVDLAAELGEKLPAEPDAAALEAFLHRRKQADPTRFADLSLAVVKLMGSGEYVLERPGGSAPGHFGLAVRDYTHATAPNRRFPDLITQRLLKAALAGAPLPYKEDELPALATHCTQKEDDANKVERQVRKSAAALLLENQIGRRYEAIVTGASDKGTWVRLCQPPVEGRVIRRFDGFDVGDRVQVELVGTDVERGYIDFAGV